MLGTGRAGRGCGGAQRGRPGRGTLGGVDVEARVRELGGAARPAELGGTRRSRRAVAALVAEGRLVRHGPRCVALPGADPDVVRSRLLDAPLTCVSAARAHGLSLLEPPRSTHVAVPHRHGAVRGTARDGQVVVHREAAHLLTAVPHPGVPAGLGPPVVAPAEALARLLRCQDEMAAIVAVDSALQRRACTSEEIQGLLTGPGRPAARAVLAACDGRSLSPAESVARVALSRAGLAPVPNPRIEGVGFVDLLVAGLVVVECDGYAHHLSRAAFAADRRRDRELQLQGYTVLRFPSDEVVRDAGAVVTAVTAALARG